MVAPNWNPGAPSIKGIELIDVGHAQTVIDAPNVIARLAFEAQGSHAVSDVQLFAGPGASAPTLPARYNSRPRPMMLDLVDAGNEDMGVIQQDDFNVSTVTGGVGMFNEDLSTPITASRLAASNDGLFIAASTLGAALNANFATSAYPLDRHVLGIQVNMRINISTTVRRIDPVGYVNSPWAYTVPTWTNGAQPVTVRWGEALIEGSDTTWKHWTPAMIREFATTRGVRLQCAAGPGYWRIDRLYISVYSIPERRRGVGIGSPVSANTWVNFDMTTPNATGSPTIVASDEYTLLARRINNDYSVDNVGDATLPWRLLRGFSPDGDWRRYGGQGDLREGILAARMLNGATFQAETMPYQLTRGSNVFGAQKAAQFLTLPGDGTIYGQAYVVAGWNPTVGRPAGVLRAEVYRVSDGVRVLSPVEITADQAEQLPISAPVSHTDDLGVIFRTLTLRFPESVALGAGQYEVRITSPGSTEARAWHVAAAIADWDARAQTFGGSTDYADGWFTSLGVPRPLTSTNDLSSDLQVMLVTVPAAVTGVGTSVGSLTAHHVEVCDPNVGCDGCADDTMPYVQVTWSAAPSGSPDVAGYQIDRLERGLWQRVASVPGRLTTGWADVEALIGAPSPYRVRVVRTDGVTGDWSATVTEQIPTGQVALALSSNAATGMGCVYPEVWAGEVMRPFTFSEAQDVSYARMFGRNRQVAFRPIERRGDQFERELLLSALCSVPLPSMAIFDPLRDLAWAPIDYVCVRDGEGNRWYMSLEVPEGNNRRADSRGMEMWTTSVRFVEVSDVPSVADTSVPQVTGPVRL